MSKLRPSWHRHAGNISDDLVVELSQAVGTDLSAVTGVAGRLVHVSDGTTQALSGSVFSSSNRQVTLDLGTWLQSTAVAGNKYYVEVDVTTSDGDTETYPENPARRPVLEIV